MKALLPVTLLSVLLALASCRCGSSSILLAPPPVVVYDGGEDMPTKACMVLSAAGCPVGKDPSCAAALRNDNAQGVGAMAGSDQNLACIVDAGASPAALKACGVSCN